LALSDFMPFDSDNVCDPYTLKEFVTGCKMTMGWTNYFAAGLIGLFFTVLSLLVLFATGFSLLYWLPLETGNKWNNHLQIKKGRRKYFYDFWEFRNFDWRLFAYGWTIHIIILSCLGILATGFYWLGHLFVLGQ
jgi:hypothetical protein